MTAAAPESAAAPARVHLEHGSHIIEIEAPGGDFAEVAAVALGLWQDTPAENPPLDRRPLSPRWAIHTSNGDSGAP